MAAKKTRSKSSKKPAAKRKAPAKRRPAKKPAAKKSSAKKKATKKASAKPKRATKKKVAAKKGGGKRGAGDTRVDQIQRLIGVMVEAGAVEVELEEAGTKLRVCLKDVSPAVVSLAAPHPTRSGTPRGTQANTHQRNGDSRLGTGLPHRGGSRRSHPSGRS